MTTVTATVRHRVIDERISIHILRKIPGGASTVQGPVGGSGTGGMRSPGSRNMQYDRRTTRNSTRTMARHDEWRQNIKAEFKAEGELVLEVRVVWASDQNDP